MIYISVFLPRVRKPFFSPVITDFRLFHCSTLHWSNSTRTPALHSESSVDCSDVMATAAAEIPLLKCWLHPSDGESAGCDGNSCAISADRSVVVVVVDGEVGSVSSDRSCQG